MPLGAQLPQKGCSLLRWPERNQVAQSLVDREQTDPAAVGLGQMRTVQLLVPKSADQEMPVVDERVFHAGVGEIGRQLRLPDPLGEPQSGRRHPEAPLEVLAHAADLLEAVGAGERGPDRLIESGEQHLEPATPGEPAATVRAARLPSLQATLTT